MTKDDLFSARLQAWNWFWDHLPGRVQIERLEFRHERRNYGWDDWIVLSVKGTRIDKPFHLHTMVRSRIDPRAMSEAARTAFLVKSMEDAVPMMGREIQGMLAEYWRWQ